jgi:hypothetical protein
MAGLDSPAIEAAAAYWTERRLFILEQCLDIELALGPRCPRRPDCNGGRRGRQRPRRPRWQRAARRRWHIHAAPAGAAVKSGALPSQTIQLHDPSNGVGGFPDGEGPDLRIGEVND